MCVGGGGGGVGRLKELSMSFLKAYMLDTKMCFRLFVHLTWTALQHMLQGV